MAAPHPGTTQDRHHQQHGLLLPAPADLQAGCRRRRAPAGRDVIAGIPDDVIRRGTPVPVCVL